MSLYEANCLGTSSNVLYDQTCNIPFSVLRDPLRFNLAQNDLVKVQIRATNFYGASILSDKNTVGALV